ncbi:hypothetical protein HDU67_001100, partial [Dinochytrium kinnereticum]
MEVFGYGSQRNPATSHASSLSHQDSPSVGDTRRKATTSIDGEESMAGDEEPVDARDMPSNLIVGGDIENTLDGDSSEPFNYDAGHIHQVQEVDSQLTERYLPFVSITAPELQCFPGGARATNEI